MRIGIEQVDKQVEKHLTEGIDALCERLNLDAPGIAVGLASQVGIELSSVELAGIAIGIDIGLEVAAERYASQKTGVLQESEHHHDEFLASLPEAQSAE